MSFNFNFFPYIIQSALNFQVKIEKNEQYEDQNEQFLGFCTNLALYTNLEKSELKVYTLHTKF